MAANNIKTVIIMCPLVRNKEDVGAADKATMRLVELQPYQSRVTDAQ